jgi:peptide/nickel transport system substrate-binding protein
MAAGLAAIACACAPSSPPVPPGSLVVGLEAAPTTLDPRYGTDEKASLIGDLLYQGLTRLDGHGSRVPDLAASWDAAPTRYVFHLRTGFFFHDGSPLTAADVKATYESVLDPAAGSPKREALASIERIETPDDRTVVFVLREPFGPFLDGTGLGILPARELGAGRSNVTIGCGPFRLASFQRDTAIALLPVAQHPDGAPRLPGVLFKIVPDDTVRALELSRGALHLVQNAIDPDMLPWLSRDDDMVVRSAPGTTFHYLGLNLRDPRLGIPAVRQAIAHGIDREAIIRHLLKGQGRAATGLLAPQHWAYASEVTTYAYAPDRARVLLDQAGFPDPDGPGPLPRFRLLYKGSSLQLRRRLAEVLQDQLARVGIALDLRSYEWGTLYADIRRGNFQIYALAWVGVSDPDIYYSLFHSAMMPPRGNNRGGFADAAVDALLESARRTADPEVRAEIYRKVQSALAVELPVIPLWWTPNVVVHTTRLRGFEPEPQGSLRSLRVASLERDRKPAPAQGGTAGTGSPSDNQAG